MSLSSPTPLADAELVALAGLDSTTADQMPYFTGVGAAALKSLHTDSTLGVSRTVYNGTQLLVEDVMEISSNVYLELASTNALLSIESVAVAPSVFPVISYVSTSDVVIGDYQQIVVSDVYELLSASLELAGNGGLLTIV